MESWVDRSGFYLEQLAGLESNCLADSVAVLRTPLQSLENEKIQRPLQYLDASLIWPFHVGGRDPRTSKRSLASRCRYPTPMDVDRLPLHNRRLSASPGGFQLGHA